MTNVTKKKIDTKDFARAKQELVRILGGNSTAASFVDEVLTEAEQIMLIKRFAAILMYQQGYSPYRVWNTLYISPATADRIHESFCDGHYANITKAVNIAKASGLLSFIEDLIVAQASPKARARLLKRAGF